MRKAKKLVSLALSSAMVLSLAACGGSSTETTAASAWPGPSAVPG